jgi:ATP-dependent DNA helicase PIF1
MCVANIPKTPLINGLIGTVLGFATPEIGADESNVELDSTAPNVACEPRRRIALPVVQFNHPSLEAFPPVFILPHTFKSTNGDGQTVATRRQIPIVLAYGITVHKAQGQTLPRLTLDMSKTFAPGKFYIVYYCLCH